VLLSPAALVWAADAIQVQRLGPVSSTTYSYTTDAITGTATAYTNDYMIGKTCVVEYFPDATSPMDNTFTVKLYPMRRVKNADGNLATVVGTVDLTGGGFSVVTANVGVRTATAFTMNSVSPLKVLVTETAGTASSGHLNIVTFP
jgi:hypothetical protein